MSDAERDTFIAAIVHALFNSALTAFAGDGFDPAGAQAVDLGCGDGTETAALLAQGW
jgi:hypothetical protein